MSVRANWFAELDDEPSTDVSDALTERVEDVGVPFDLRDPDLVLEDLDRLISQEAALFNQGITCPVKDRPDTSCSACPVAHHQEGDHPLQPLCHVGREQERVLTQNAHVRLRQQ